MKSNPSTGSAAELADESADDKGREIVLKNHKLLRRLYLQERLEVNEDVCAICDFNREILYYGNYDRNRNVECFNVCELCGKDLITNSAALESPRGTNAPSELLLQIKNDFILTMPQSRAGKPISMKEAASLRVYKGLTELGEILRADSHSDAALAALKARIDGERKRANERIEAKRQQGYVYGALQYECNDDVVRLALLERLEASTTATEEGSR